MNDAFELSLEARSRRQEMLPGLLHTVRRRRHRRQLTRGAVVAGLLAVLVVWWSPFGGSHTPAALPPVEMAWVTIGNDPTAVERCTVATVSRPEWYVDEAPLAAVDVVATVSRPEWYVDDSGLQELLVAAGRPSGFVRYGDQMLFSPGVVDPWPQLED